VLGVSPFGKKESFASKMRRTWRIFGTAFFIRYGFLYLINKFNPGKSVKRVLNAHQIPVIQLEKRINNPESLAIIRSYKPDLLVSIAANQIFKTELINLAPQGCLNLHTALLPKYRGVMPSFWVLKNNETKTGVSVFYVDEGIDSGPILVQKEIEIGPSMTQAELIRVSKKIGMDAIIEAIDKIHRGETQTMPNPESEKTYFSFPQREDVIAFRKAGRKFY
jgi:methionyl-tRNA formyltransferase